MLERQCRTIYYNARWVSLISRLPGKALRKPVDIARLAEISRGLPRYREACRDIARLAEMPFDVMFTRQGFENACRHHEACRTLQHAFSKPILVNLISKYPNLVLYLSVYLLFPSLN